MVVLILGLVIFLGSHSVRIFAEEWRHSQIARMKEGPWKGVYSLISIIGFVLIIWGYGMARPESAVIYEPPVWLKHIAVALNLLAFILLAAFAVPAGRLKAKIGHPMVLAVKVWAVAHILANGRMVDLVLFGALLVWAIADYAASRRRDRAQGVVRIAGPVQNDAIAVSVGVIMWAAFVWRVHAWLIGVSPVA